MVLLHLLLAFALGQNLVYSRSLADLGSERFELRLAAQKRLAAAHPYPALYWELRTSSDPEIGYQVGEVLAEGQRRGHRWQSEAEKTATPETWAEIAQLLINLPGERENLPLAPQWALRWVGRNYELQAALITQGINRGLLEPASAFDSGWRHLDDLRLTARGLPTLTDWHYSRCPLRNWLSPLELWWWARKRWDPRPLLLR